MNYIMPCLGCKVYVWTFREAVTQRNDGDIHGCEYIENERKRKIVNLLFLCEYKGIKLRLGIIYIYFIFFLEISNDTVSNRGHHNLGSEFPDVVRDDERDDEFGRKNPRECYQYKYDRIEPSSNDARSDRSKIELPSLHPYLHLCEDIAIAEFSDKKSDHTCDDDPRSSSEDGIIGILVGPIYIGWEDPDKHDEKRKEDHREDPRPDDPSRILISIDFCEDISENIRKWKKESPTIE